MNHETPMAQGPVDGRVGRQCSFCQERPRYQNECGWGYTKDLAEDWLLSCPRCCAEAGGAIREIADDGGAGECRY